MTETHSVKGRSHTMLYKYLLPHVPGVLLGITNDHLSLLILRSPWTPERRALPIKAQKGSLEEQLLNNSNQMVHVKKKIKVIAIRSYSNHRKSGSRCPGLPAGCTSQDHALPKRPPRMPHWFSAGI